MTAPFICPAKGNDNGERLMSINPKNIVTGIAVGIILIINLAAQTSKPAKTKYVEYDDSGNVPIGITGTGSKLAVGGVIESTTGGVKFPDGSVQTSAGITQVVTSGALSGNGTAASPLTISGSLDTADPDSTRQPFNKRILSNVGDTGAVLATVPAGKILIVEFITGYTGVPDTVNNTALSLTIDGSLTAFVSPRNVVPNSTGFRLWYYSDPIKLRLTAGQVLGVTFYSGGENLVLVNGYYVNAP